MVAGCVNELLDCVAVPIVYSGGSLDDLSIILCIIDDFSGGFPRGGLLIEGDFELGRPEGRCLREAEGYEE